MVLATISPECRLVFRSADPACEGAEYAALAAAVRDWPRAYQIAERELATLAVWRALLGAGVPVPAEVADAFRRSALQTDLRMQQLSRKLQQTAETLASRRIPFLLLKGAAVGALADPTFRFRPMTDIDLLVHREDVAGASQSILDAGWSVTTNPVYLEMLKEAHHHLPHFVDPRQPGIRLELHVALLPDDQPFAFDEAPLWRDARPAEAPFAAGSVPSPEHLLLHASLHFAWQHTMTFGAWRTFRLAAACTVHQDFDWDRFVDAARTAKAGSCCYWALRLARDMSRVELPENHLRRLAPPTPGWARDALARHFIAGLVPGEGPTSPSVRLSRLLWTAALRPGWSGHANPGRWDAEQRWEKAYGSASTESGLQRLRRHAAEFGRWRSFVSRTLLP